MQYIFEFVLNFLLMGKPAKKDIKWFPVLILIFLLLIGFTAYYNAKM